MCVGGADKEASGLIIVRTGSSAAAAAGDSERGPGESLAHSDSSI